MLYEFHRHQNAKKPGTIHATYLLSGTKPEEIVPAVNPIIKRDEKDGEDEVMQSSPFMSSSMAQPEEDIGSISTVTVSLVREEDLESKSCTPCQIFLTNEWHRS
jgi:DNA polymerase delta subunit 3